MTNLLALKIGTNTLQRVTSYEYLGIHIDEALSFNKALSIVYGRTSNKLYMLGLLRKYLSVKSALRIFKAMVLPYMEYVFFCISPCSDKDLTKLQRLQNKGLRVCLKLPSRTSVLRLHSDSRLLLVKNKIKLNILKQMHRYINREDCLYKRQMNNIDRYTRSLLGPTFINVFPNSVRFQKSLCGKGFSLWNKLPAFARKIKDKDSFADTLKNVLFTEQDAEFEEQQGHHAPIEDLHNLLRRL